MMNGEIEMKIKTIYTVKQKRVVDDYYIIEATSKAEALRKFEDGDHNYDYETYTDKEYKPSAEKLYDILECPNKGEAWTNISRDVKVNSFSWHYNGKCKGERTEDEKHCYTCKNAMRDGHRLLTLEEKKYLNETYSYNDLNTEE